MGVIVFGSCVTLFVMAIAVLQIYVGYSLSVQKNATLCLIVAVLSLLQFPLGTALGIFMLIVLNRATVQALFAEKRALRDAGAEPV
jgi:hypothetical protein